MDPGGRVPGGGKFGGIPDGGCSEGKEVTSKISLKRSVPGVTVCSMQLCGMEVHVPSQVFF